jgi:hypothetical protein
MSYIEIFNFPILGIIEAIGVGGSIALYGSLAATAISGAINYNSAQNAAKQSELNAQAQANAIGQEQQRQALQEQENQRRAVQEQRRFRAAQLSAMGGSGAMLGTGSTLALEADTWAKQQTDLADQQRMADLSQRNLAYQASSTLQMGQQQGAQIRADATGKAISDLGSAAATASKAWSTRAQPAKPTYDSAGVVRAVPV